MLLIQKINQVRKKKIKKLIKLLNHKEITIHLLTMKIQKIILLKIKSQLVLILILLIIFIF